MFREMEHPIQGGISDTGWNTVSWTPEDSSATSADETATEALSAAPTDDAVHEGIAADLRDAGVPMDLRRQ
jgi:hypothetical protein